VDDRIPMLDGIRLEQSLKGPPLLIAQLQL
jgi:hypothetical protein